MTHSIFAASLLIVTVTASAFAEAPWKKHVVHEGERCNTAVAADFTGGGRPDSISKGGGGFDWAFSWRAGRIEGMGRTGEVRVCVIGGPGAGAGAGALSPADSASKVSVPLHDCFYQYLMETYTSPALAVEMAYNILDGVKR